MPMATRKPTRAPAHKTCKQITDLVLNYLNDELSPATKRAFQRHLRICPDCVNFLNTYKKTITVSRSVAIDEIPQRVRDNILTFLRKRMHRLGSHALVIMTHALSASGLLAAALSRCIDFIIPRV